MGPHSAGNDRRSQICGSNTRMTLVITRILQGVTDVCKPVTVHASNEEVARLFLRVDFRRVQLYHLIRKRE
jgi:hypothetical protein